MTGVSRWLFLDTGENDGKFNMRLDLQLVARFQRVRAQGLQAAPVLRFYRWKPYCISLGRNQSESDIDFKLTERDGIDVVKRPTGGKAVLHAEELTYSVIMETRGLSVRDTYNSISRALVAGLRTLGADLELSESSADFQKLFRDPSAIPCFSTSAVFEVEYRGKKLVGSAQHRFGDVLLQHGSILAGDFHKQIVDYLAVDQATKAKTRDDLESHTTTLSEVLGTIVELENVKKAVRDGFEKEYGAEFEPETASEVEREMFDDSVPRLSGNFVDG